MANFGSEQAGQPADESWNDVILLHEITKVDGLEELISDAAARDEQGLFAIHTSRSGSSLGRKYCLQVVGLIPPLHASSSMPTLDPVPRPAAHLLSCPPAPLHPLPNCPTPPLEHAAHV